MGVTIDISKGNTRWWVDVIDTRTGEVIHQEHFLSLETAESYKQMLKNYVSNAQRLKQVLDS